MGTFPSRRLPKIVGREAASIVLYLAKPSNMVLRMSYRIFFSFRWEDTRPTQVQPRRPTISDRLAEFYTSLVSDPEWSSVAAGIGDHLEERALRLLQENLSPAQRSQYQQHQYFDVVGGTSGKRYRIRDGLSMNVEELRKDGSLACRWCFSPRGRLAMGDVMLAQKLALELYECEALGVANRV
jgi:hypothetical protein